SPRPSSTSARSRRTPPGRWSNSSPRRPPHPSSGSTAWSPLDPVEIPRRRCDSRPGCRWKPERRRGNRMKHGVSTLLFALAAVAPAAHAQQSALNETQQLGRQVFAQSCGIGHLQPSLGVQPYGPVLSTAAPGGNDEVMRAFLLNGTDRMPASNEYLKPAEIDAIIAYVRTVPVPAT